MVFVMLVAWLLGCVIAMNMDCLREIWVGLVSDGKGGFCLIDLCEVMRERDGG